MYIITNNIYYHSLSHGDTTLQVQYTVSKMLLILTNVAENLSHKSQHLHLPASNSAKVLMRLLRAMMFLPCAGDRKGSVSCVIRVSFVRLFGDKWIELVTVLSIQINPFASKLTVYTKQ